MSRYLERAEHLVRVVDVYLDRLLELSRQSGEARWGMMLASLHAPSLAPGSQSPYERVGELLFDTANSASLAFCIEKARENARQVREQISSEMWEQLNQLYLYVRKSSAAKSWQSQPHDFFTSVKQGSHLFQGIADSTMNHSEGWDFIQVGRFIERAGSVAAVLDSHYAVFMRSSEDAVQPDDYFDWVCLLKSCTAFEAYCKVYTANLRPYAVAEFLLLNAEFPHSIRFSVDMLQNALLGIAEATGTNKSGRANRMVGRLLAALNFGQIEEIIAQGVNGYLKDVQRQCSQIHSAFYQTYISYPIDSSRLRLESGHG